MLGHLYPNLERAQAKSSLKYRIPTPTGKLAEGAIDRPRSPDAPIELSPSRRQYHVPVLFHAQSESAVLAGDHDRRGHARDSKSVGCLSGKWHKPVTRKRGRKGDLASSPSPSLDHRAHRAVSLTTPGEQLTYSTENADLPRTGSAYGGLRFHRATASSGENSPPSFSPSLVQKLETIDQIIARAERDDQPPQAGESLLISSPSAELPRCNPNVLILDPLQDATGEPFDRSRLLQSAQARRKVDFLLSQQDQDQGKDARREDTANAAWTSPPRRRRTSGLGNSPSKQASTKYLITTNMAAEAAPSCCSQPVLAPILTKQDSQQQINNARVMEFVDGVNNKPRGSITVAPNGTATMTTTTTTTTTTVALDKQLRRISLVSFEPPKGAARTDERRLLSRSDSSSLVMRRKQVFGIYSIREVMAVIRLFWFLDADRSDGITLDELHLHRPFFQKLGRGDLDAVFRELDVDGNGAVALHELLRVCFRHANDHQLQAMLTLAKVGNVREYLTGRHSVHRVEDDKAKPKSQEQRRAELDEIFCVFDRNGDGKINRVELLEALEIDHELFSPALETTRESWAENARRMERVKTGGLTKTDIERFYSEYDANSDGTLDFDEFVRLMEVAAS